MFNDDFPLKSKTILTNKVNNTVGEDGKENQEFLEFLIYEEKSQENHRDDTQHHISCNKREKSDDFFFCFLFLISQAYIPLAKRKGVALVFAILEINFGVLRPEAAKAANHARRRDRTAPNESFFWN